MFIQQIPVLCFCGEDLQFTMGGKRHLLLLLRYVSNDWQRWQQAEPKSKLHEATLRTITDADFHSLEYPKASDINVISVNRRGSWSWSHFREFNLIVFSFSCAFFIHSSSFNLYFSDLPLTLRSLFPLIPVFLIPTAVHQSSLLLTLLSCLLVPSYLVTSAYTP